MTLDQVKKEVRSALEYARYNRAAFPISDYYKGKVEGLSLAKHLLDRVANVEINKIFEYTHGSEVE